MTDYPDDFVPSVLEILNAPLADPEFAKSLVAPALVNHFERCVNAMAKPADYPRCKTCKHWDDRVEGEELFRDCTNIRISVGYYSDEAIADPFATGPDFGCVHHEPKESE